MTLEEIKADCDMAELNGGLNFNEIPFRTLYGFVSNSSIRNNESKEDFDVVSVCNMLEQWWIGQNKEPTIDQQIEECLNERFQKRKNKKAKIKSCAWCCDFDGCDLLRAKRGQK